MRVAFIVAILACLAVSAVAQQITGTATVKFFSDTACANHIGSSSYPYAYTNPSNVGVFVPGNVTAPNCAAITGTNTSYPGTSNTTYVQGTSYLPLSTVVGVTGGSWSFILYPTANCNTVPVSSASLAVSSASSSANTDLTQCTPVIGGKWWTRVYGSTAATTTISFAVAAVALLASIATFTF